MEHEYEVKLTATFRGCVATVMANNAEEACMAAERGDFTTAIDTAPAELVDWTVTRVCE